MDLTWTVPVAAILGGTAYAVFLRYFKHKERLASARLDLELLHQRNVRIDTLESRKDESDTGTQRHGDTPPRAPRLPLPPSARAR